MDSTLRCLAYDEYDENKKILFLEYVNDRLAMWEPLVGNAVKNSKRHRDSKSELTN